MCNRAAYKQRRKMHHDQHGHWMAGKRNRWAKHKKLHNRSNASVNIQELDDSYELFLSAPGLSKEAFTISLKDNFLTISAEKKEFELGENARWKRYEFSAGGFKREFELNDKINLEGISAKYEGGILQVTLPKFEDSITSRHDISVA